MPKPTTITITGRFELPIYVSLADLQKVLTKTQDQLVTALGPGTLVCKIGRQELRA